MQTQQKMTGTFNPCRCGKQPKFYSERHDQLFFGECAPCSSRTPKFPTKQEAIQAWEDSNTSTIAGRAP